MRSAIVSVAHALPSKVLTYEELAERFGAKEVATIFKMSGIRNRRVAAPSQCASDLALAAARRLIDHRQIDPQSIDLLVFASQTPDYRIPATASVLQGRLGLGEKCCAFDINQACTSYVHALAIANAMIVAGTASRALVLSGDTLTKLVHPLDRGLVTLHGDAAAATLLEPSDLAAGGIEFFEFGSDGSKFGDLLVPAGAFRHPSSAESRTETTDGSGCTRTPEHLFMNGPAVFHFCVYKVTDFLKQFLKKRGLSVDDFDLVLLHQANRTMVDLVYKSLGVPADKRFYYLEDVGNSSGASLPGVLGQAWRAGVVKPGSRTLLCAFGGGLSWGALSVRWADNAAAAVPGEIDVPETKETA